MSPWPERGAAGTSCRADVTPARSASHRGRTDGHDPKSARGHQGSCPPERRLEERRGRKAHAAIEREAGRASDSIRLGRITATAELAGDVTRPSEQRSHRRQAAGIGMQARSCAAAAQCERFESRSIRPSRSPSTIQRVRRPPSASNASPDGRAALRSPETQRSANLAKPGAPSRQRSSHFSLAIRAHCSIPGAHIESPECSKTAQNEIGQGRSSVSAWAFQARKTDRLEPEQNVCSPPGSRTDARSDGAREKLRTHPWSYR